jgi:transposase
MNPMPSPIKYDRKQRFNWYLPVEKNQSSVKEICQLFNISRKTFYKWRSRDYGLNTNDYQSIKKQPNTKLTHEVKHFIEEQKLITNYGPLKMQMLIKRKLNLDISTTTIYRFYQRKQLIRKPQKKLPWYQPIKHAIKVLQQGEAVQMDVKYIYELGKRMYKFSVLDPFTLKYHFTIFQTKESKNAIMAFKRAEKYFGFKIISVQTDNGSEFRGIFHTWLTKHQIPHYFIPKKSPWWNAEVERIHRTIDDEYYHNTYRVWKNVYHWLNYYNFERIHLTLNGLTPQEKLESVTLDC